MIDKHYPTTDFDFIDKCLMDSGKIVDRTEIGSLVVYVNNGKSFIGKRLVTIKPDKNKQVNYMQATGLASRYNFLSPLLNWLETNRNWKDGAYVAQNLSDAEKNGPSEA